MNEERQASEEQAAQLFQFVAGEMKAGTDKSGIAAKLQEQGMDRTESEQLVDTVYRQVAEAVKQEAFSPASLIPALVGGVVAALIGGAVWAGIVVLTDYEVGFIAWGIGALCGFAVVMASNGRKGVPLQIVAVATAMLGIVIGKYFSFYHFLKQYLAEEEGAEAAQQVSLFSMGLVQYFVQTLPGMLGLYDVLFFGLAILTAWGIPRGSGIKVPSGATGPIG